MTNWIHDYNTLPAEKIRAARLAFDGKLKYCRAWSDYYGRPIHLGEFGAYTKADDQSRANFYSAFRRACEALEIWLVHLGLERGLSLLGQTKPPSHAGNAGGVVWKVGMMIPMTFHCNGGGNFGTFQPVEGQMKT